MRVMLFGATGMLGQGVLRECVLDDGVERILVVGRTPTGVTGPKIEEVVREDLFDLSGIELGGYDACFFCLGVSSVGMSEAEYRRITYDLTLSVARPLAAANPEMTFVYISGAGTDSTESGRTMWARVKGATENALLNLPFRAAYMLRPGYIQPLHGARTKTTLYQVIYAVAAPLYPILRSVFPSQVTTTEQVGLAMLALARRGGPKRILNPRDINEAATPA